MKKLKIVWILAAAILIGGVISLPLINNHTAYKVEKALCEIPLPEETELIESLSQAGKLTGNGNGMQYFGAILIRSELSLEELDAYYSDYRRNEWEYLVEIQKGQSIEVIDHETLQFSEEIKVLQSKAIQLPSQGLVMRKGKVLSNFDISNRALKLVVYADSVGCTACAINHIDSWSSFIDYAEQFNEQLRFYFIFAPLKRKTNICRTKNYFLWQTYQKKAIFNINLDLPGYSSHWLSLIHI